MEFKIRHDGKEWVLENEEAILTSPTMDGLDQKVREYVHKRGAVKPGEKLEVKMFFQNETIPQWIRQYSQHYFNRILVVEG
ncbi:MAG: hypothetical protein D6726_07420 [Nitrospirae bacterium]|nr:MAG: hypothetical protein D6726_07420 [Nitrospirota bacterium]